MNKNDLVFYNDYFEKIKGVKKTKQFQYNSDIKKFEGEILYESKKGNLKFAVEIPETYPLGDIKFITNDFDGYPHQNFDGSLCLNTSFVNHIYTRLNLEIDKLQNYIEYYFEKECEDTQYEYSAKNEKGLVTLIFQENQFEESRFSAPFGVFKYSILSYHRNEKNKISKLTALAQNIGNKELQWSNSYKTKEKYIGIWVLIDKEPVHRKKQRFTNWADLAEILPKEFFDFFNVFTKSSANYKLYPKGLEDNIFLTIGYKIPNNENYEINWDLVLLPRYDFPRKTLMSGGLQRYLKPIQWDKTYNSSYNRFFGRGSLEYKFASQKILIIGNGAVGSSLAESLTRSGATQIDLADIDLIEPGNICRSIFNFNEVSFSKANQLKVRLENISPFIEVGLFENLKAISSKSEEFSEIHQKLMTYDVIFDCTANNEIIQMLTDIDLENRIFYISMSNKAKEMICVTNADNVNLIERRNQMLYSFGTFNEPEFREGTGCWHPTFEASYFDINQLLQFTLRKINDFYIEQRTPKTFYTFFNQDIIGVSEDLKYYQPDLKLTLTIESSVLENIEDYSRINFPNEFGGILLGSYFNNYTELVISDIICPEKFKQSPTGFVPDHKELNERLIEYYKLFDDKVIYVGDWHSHPNSTNHFSLPDFNSTKEVANSKTVNIKNPILLIVAFGTDYFDPGFYVYNKDKLFKFSREDNIRRTNASR
jgi:proteasome lid subunit RPN8/RPN11